MLLKFLNKKEQDVFFKLCAYSFPDDEQYYAEFGSLIYEYLKEIGTNEQDIKIAINHLKSLGLDELQRSIASMNVLVNLFKFFNPTFLNDEIFFNNCNAYVNNGFTLISEQLLEISSSNWLCCFVLAYLNKHKDIEVRDIEVQRASNFFDHLHLQAESNKFKSILTKLNFPKNFHEDFNMPKELKNICDDHKGIFYYEILQMFETLSFDSTAKAEIIKHMDFFLEPTQEQIEQAKTTAAALAELAEEKEKLLKSHDEALEQIYAQSGYLLAELESDETSADE